MLHITHQRKLLITRIYYNYSLSPIFWREYSVYAIDLKCGRPLSPPALMSDGPTDPDPEADFVILSVKSRRTPQPSSTKKKPLVVDLTGEPDDAPVLLSTRNLTTAPVDPPPPRQSLLCPICMEPAKDPSATTCGHVFCTQCLKRSMAVNSLCPTCRKKLTKTSVHRLFL